MRKTLIAFAAFLCIGAVASCSSDSKKATTTPAANTSQSSSSSSSGNVKTKTTLGSAEFCQKISAAFDALDNQSSLSGGREALAAFQSVEPPQELADVWDDFLKALDEISHADPNDRGAFAQIASRHGASVVKVSNYIGTSCAALGQSQLSSLSDSLSS